MQSPFEDKPRQVGENFLDRTFNSEYEFMNRYPSGFPTLAESYTEGSNEIHVHLTVRDCEYCAVFYRAAMDETVGEPILVNAEGRQIDGRSDQIEVPMLLNVSKTTEQSQKTARTMKVRSMVRLQLLNSCDDGRLDSLQLTSDVLGVPIFRLPTQREAGLSAGLTPASDDEAPSEMIQHTAIVVEGIAKAERNRLGRRRDLSPDAPRVLQTFVLEIVNNYTWLRPPEGYDVLPKGIHVLVRPPELRLEAIVKSPHCSTTVAIDHT